MNHKKHLFFDLDDTVTASRTLMEPEVYELYASLSQDIVVVSGAQVSQIDTQIHHLPVFRLGQNGNQAVGPKNEILWTEYLTPEQVSEVLTHVEKLKKMYTGSVRNEDDLVENRGAQISYSLIGHHEDLENKKKCDPDRQVRLSLLERAPFISDELEVKIGGTTCFDYFQKGRHKGYNVMRLIDRMGWRKEDCVYFGDALFPGGNDETVIGVIDTFPVKNHLHTYEVLRTHLTLNHTE